jgi:nucleoside 2-deoxyribosyltransferase
MNGTVIVVAALSILLLLLLTRDSKRIPVPKPRSNGGSKTLYWAGPLFSWTEIYGNEALSKLIEEMSKGRYKFILPQNLPQDNSKPAEIRKQDLAALASADGLIANIDGSDADTGTVVEIVTAQHQKKPIVLVRTDPRLFYEGIHVNPMLIDPEDERTRIVRINALIEKEKIPHELARLILEALDSLF